VTLTLKELRHGYTYEIHLKNLAPARQPFFPADAYYTMRSKKRVEKESRAKS